MGGPGSRIQVATSRRERISEAGDSRRGLWATGDFAAWVVLLLRASPELAQELGFPPPWRARYPFGKLDTAPGLLRQPPSFLIFGSGGWGQPAKALSLGRPSLTVVVFLDWTVIV